MNRNRIPSTRLLTIALVALALAAVVAARLWAQSPAKLPGVGYVPRSGVNTSCSPWAVRSIAVVAVDASRVVTTAQPHALAVGDQVLAPRTLAVVAAVPSPTQLALNGGQPVVGGVLTTWYLRSLMACRYGPRWEAGKQGPHSTDYERYMREDFANHVARWNPDYSRYDGNPTAEEVTDAYYSSDTRVLPLPPAPTPRPTAEPAPTATATPPQPTPTIAPPDPLPTATPCETCKPCDDCPAPAPVPIYEAMPARHRETYLSAPYWKRDANGKLTRAQQRRLDAANDWTRAHPTTWYVPGERSSGNVSSTIETWQCEPDVGGWWCNDEESVVATFVPYPTGRAAIAARGGL